MPLIPVPSDPTWADIEAGMTAAAAESRAARLAARAARAAVKRAKDDERAANSDGDAADRNYSSWEAAIRRKTARP